MWRVARRAAVHRTWYRIALAREGGEPTLVAAEGEHLGAAIAAARVLVDGKGKRDDASFPIAVERATDTVPLGESVGKQHAVALPEPEEIAAAVYHWPHGVVPRLGYTPDVRTAYTIHETNPDLFVVEAQVEADRVTDTFLGVLERLPSADNLEIRVLDHFEDALATDVWLTSRVNGNRILSFLDDHETELIDNGHVELGIYVRAHKATLRLTEHKTVVWVSDGDSMRADVTRWMSELDIPPIEPGTQLVTVASGPHFHYRPAKTKNREKLGEWLYRQRLRRVDRVPTRDPRERADDDAADDAEGARETEG